MKYIRYEAPPELRLRFHFRNRFGNDIEGAREFDPETGEGVREVGHTGVMIPFYHAQGYVEIDGHVNPSAETLQALFANSQAVLQKELMDATVKKIEEHVRFNEERT